MKTLRLFCAACMLACATPAIAQEVPDRVTTALQQQGFTITSVRYTWLGRIFIEATNGELDRGILISRGSGQVLQDDWITGAQQASPAAPAASSSGSSNNGDDNDSDNSSNGSTSSGSNTSSTDDDDSDKAPPPPRPQGNKPPPGGRP